MAKITTEAIIAATKKLENAQVANLEADINAETVQAISSDQRFALSVLRAAASLGPIETFAAGIQVGLQIAADRQ